MKRAANQGVGDFGFINILNFFLFIFFFNYFTLSFFQYFFLPTTFTHTHDPRPLPTTHDPRHLAALNGLLFMTFEWFYFFISVFRSLLCRKLFCLSELDWWISSLSDKNIEFFFLTKASSVVTNVDYWHIVGQKQKLTLKATSQVSFRYNKCARYFFSSFSRIFLIQKQHVCVQELFFLSYLEF